MNSLADLPIQKLKRAVELREQIEMLNAELSQLLEPSGSFRAHNRRNGFLRNGNGTHEKQHGLTDAGRARIAAAQRLRWSKYNAGGAIRSKAASRQTRLSTAGRAKVSAAVRARWARFRAAKARALRAK